MTGVAIAFVASSTAACVELLSVCTTLLGTDRLGDCTMSCALALHAMDEKCGVRGGVEVGVDLCTTRVGVDDQEGEEKVCEADMVQQCGWSMCAQTMCILCVILAGVDNYFEIRWPGAKCLRSSPYLTERRWDVVEKKRLMMMCG